MEFRLSIAGDQQIARRFVRFADNVEDARPVFRNLMGTYRKRSSKQFTSQGKSGSGGWKPLKPSTVAAKKRAGLDRRILHATLRLRESMTGSHPSDGIRIILPGSMAFGSTVKYAPYHQHGTKNMPRRRVLELTEAERRADLKTIQRFIVTGRV